MGMHDDSYSNGQKTKLQKGDILTYYFENGEIKAEGPFINGKMEGKWKFFKKEGFLWQEGSFKDNVKHGEWLRYRADGGIENKSEFENGTKKS